MKNLIALLAIASLFFQPILNSSILLSEGTTILVNTLEDEKNEDGDCSLREAMESTINNQPVDACPAGSATELDTILFSVSGSILLTSALPLLTAGPDLSIDGQEQITIDCARFSDIFKTQGGNLTLKNLILTNSSGRVVVSQGNIVALEGVIFQNNPSTSEVLYSTGKLTIQDSSFINNGNIKKEIYSAMYIVGEGSTEVINSTFSNNQAIDAAIYVGYNANLTIQDSFFLNNIGGVIEVNGIVNISKSTFEGNTNPSSSGGAIKNGGMVTISDTIFRNNHSDQVGGAISTYRDLTIHSSTFEHNSAVWGGALDINAPGDIYLPPVIKINNSTFTENEASERAGAIKNGGHDLNPTNSLLTISSSTFHNNRSVTGATFYNNSNSKAKLEIRNSIVAGQPGTDHCYGAITDLGSNLDSGSDCGFMASGSLSNVDPLLEPLADNGGSTPTHALQPGSPALDGVVAGSCLNESGTFQITDQRGLYRPVDGNGDEIRACDIGSYEANATPVEMVYLPCTHREHCPPYLFDDFSTYKYNWPVGNDSYAEVGYAYNQYKVKVLQNNSTVAVRIVPKYEHPIILVDARPQSAASKSYGIAFNISDDFSEFNTFEIYPDGKYEIWRHNPTSPYWRLLKGGSSGAIKTGTEWNTLKVDVDGPNISVYVNGHFIITVQESKYADGYRTAGLVSSTQDEHISTEIRFDNFTVYTRDCAEYAVPVMPVLLNLEHEAISIQERRPEIRP